MLAPSAAVVAVENEIWQDAVLSLAGAADAVLFDVSGYTENIGWEIDQMLDRHGDKCLFIAEAGSFARWSDEAAGDPGSSLAARIHGIRGADLLLYDAPERLDVDQLGQALERLCRPSG